MNPISTPTAVTFSSEELIQPYHKHCPLCEDSIVNPEQDDRIPIIIFLDMDGPMIPDRCNPDFYEEMYRTRSELFPQVKEINEYQWRVVHGRHLDSEALKNLHSLIERIEASNHRALVVLSSAWRNDATLQQLREEVFSQYLFCKHLGGKAAPTKFDIDWTPECLQGFNFTQGAKDFFGLDLGKKSDVVEYWLLDHGFNLSSTNFVVLDDDTSEGFERFEERFVPIRYLLSKKDCEQAAKVLKL